MSTALFYVNPKPLATDPALSRKSNHSLARIFGDGVISRESFKIRPDHISEDTQTVQSKRQKYALDMPILDNTSLEPKLVHAPADRMAADPNIDQLAMKDIQDMQNVQKGVMATLIITGAAVLAWLLSSNIKMLSKATNQRRTS